MEKIQGKVKKKKDLLKFLKVEKNGSCKFNWKLIAIFIFALLILGGGITFGVVKIVKHFHKGDEAVDLSHANWEERLNEDITAVFVCADPDGYKGSVVHLKGKIFNVTSDDPTVGLQWQMWCNPENSTNGVICYF